jgi:hypothetical protein
LNVINYISLSLGCYCGARDEKREEKFNLDNVALELASRAAIFILRKYDFDDMNVQWWSGQKDMLRYMLRHETKPTFETSFGWLLLSQQLDFVSLSRLLPLRFLRFY